MKGKTFTDKKKISLKTKSIILSVVSIIELILIFTTMTYSWFEGLTSLEIIGTNLNTASRLNSRFEIGEGEKYENTTAELNTFFDAQTNGKLSPVSSADGENFYGLYSGSATDYQSYLSGVNNGSLKFRKLTDEDVNSSIISFQFEVTAATSDTDFWLKKMPEFTVGGTKLTNENNPFRIRIDDGDGDTANGEGNLILTSKETWPADGKYSTSSSRKNMLALTGVNANDTGILKEATTEITNPAINKIFDGRQCDADGWLINDNGDYIDANGNVTTAENAKVQNFNKNGKEVLFSVKKGKTKIITITIWLEAFDQAFTTSNINPGDEVNINLEFRSSWDVMDTITFRDRTAEQWVDTTNENENNATQILGVVNLGSENNHWYATKADKTNLFTYDATTHNWTGQIPRAVQNIKFQWQTKGTSNADAYWEAGVRGTNTTYTAFGSNESGSLWYNGETIQISMSDYTSDQWLDNVIDGVASKMRVQVTYNGTPLSYSMTDSPAKDDENKNTWYAYIPEVDTVVFNRCKNSTPNEATNTWNGTNRGVETKYYALDGGVVDTIEGTAIYLTIYKGDNQEQIDLIDQAHGPAVSIPSDYNIGLITGNGNGQLNGNRAGLDNDNYITGADGDAWPSGRGTMTLVEDDEYKVTYVYYFDELAADTYLSFWSVPHIEPNGQRWHNIGNNAWVAPCFLYDGTNNQFEIYTATTLGKSIGSYVFNDCDTFVYEGSDGNVTTPGKEQNGQWGKPKAPELAEGTYTTFFKHSKSVTSVTASFTYKNFTYSVELDGSGYEWSTNKIPDDATGLTFTDNNGSTWSVDDAAYRSSTKNYYYVFNSGNGELSSAGFNRVYLTNNKSWSAVSVYSWVTGSSGSPAWPGKAMTNLYTDPTSGYKIYAALVPSGQNIIFNNNDAGQQSKDIPSNYVYDMAGFVLSGSSTPYEYLIYNAKNGNYASANVTAGTYGTRFVHTGTVTGVSAVFTFNNVEYTVPMTLDDGTTWITHAIPDAVTTITFKDTSNHTWNNTTGRTSTNKYYFMDSNTTGHWGAEPVVETKNMLYLKPNSNWTQANARFAAYFFGGTSGTKWVSMVASDQAGIYEVEIPDGDYPKVIFCRMNPSTTANNWNEGVKWNQTGDLTIPTNGNNLCAINSGQWDCGTNVTWSKK